MLDPLDALCPLDGRYAATGEPLRGFFGEGALMRYRVLVECEYLIALAEHPETNLRAFSALEKEVLRKIPELSYEDRQIIKAIEKDGYKTIKPTNHDVKAVEYFIKDRLQGTSLADCSEWVHFALTSEDVNNIAYALMLSDGIENVMLPTLNTLVAATKTFGHQYKMVSMLARTHGQPASPTTMGKEFAVFASRLERQLEQLVHFELQTKLNGATGNYNAHTAAYPHVDWLQFSRDFIKGFNNNRMIKLKPNLITTQIESHDTYAELFDLFRRINTIILDFNQDIWRYISDEWIVQRPKEGEVGSSTMPHKINPIDFENSEGNLGVANALFQYFSTKLPVSRLQRDLSDSTVERNFGVALGYSLVGYNSTLRGLKKININEQKITEALEQHPEVISEGLQTILRRDGYPMPYEQLKQLTRGKKVTLADIHAFVDTLHIPESLKTELKQLTPTNYTGLAAKLVDYEER